MDCIRGAYSTIRKRIGRGSNQRGESRSQSTRDAEAGDNNHNNNTNDEKEVGRLRKFFSSLMSLQSRTTNEEVIFENETEEGISAKLPEEESKYSGTERRQKSTYTRAETEIHVSSQFSEATDRDEEIIPYSVAEKQLEEGGSEQMLNNYEEDDSDDDDDDAHIYPYPDQPHGITSDNPVEKDENVDIKIVISSTPENMDKDQGVLDDTDSFPQTPTSRRKATSGGENPSTSMTMRKSNANDRRTQEIDNESKEIYVSRNIPDSVAKDQIEDFAEIRKGVADSTVNNKATVTIIIDDTEIQNEYCPSTKNSDNENGSIKDSDEETSKGSSDHSEGDDLETQPEPSTKNVTSEDNADKMDSNDAKECSKESNVRSSNKQNEIRSESLEEVDDIHRKDSSESEKLNKTMPDHSAERSYIKNGIQITIIDEIIAEKSEVTRDGYDETLMDRLRETDEDSISVSSDADNYRVI